MSSFDHFIKDILPIMRKHRIKALTGVSLGLEWKLFTVADPCDSVLLQTATDLCEVLSGILESSGINLSVKSEETIGGNNHESN